MPIDLIRRILTGYSDKPRFVAFLRRAFCGVGIGLGVALSWSCFADQPTPPKNIGFGQQLDPDKSEYGVNVGTKHSRPCGGTSNNYTTLENCYPTEPLDHMPTNDNYWDALLYGDAVLEIGYPPPPVAPCPDGVWQYLSDQMDVYSYGDSCPAADNGYWINTVTPRKMYRAERCSSTGLLRYLETPEAMGPPSPPRCTFRSVRTWMDSK